MGQAGTGGGAREARTGTLDEWARAQGAWGRLLTIGDDGGLGHGCEWGRINQGRMGGGDRIPMGTMGDWGTGTDDVNYYNRLADSTYFNLYLNCFSLLVPLPTRPCDLDWRSHGPPFEVARCSI